MHTRRLALIRGLIDEALAQRDLQLLLDYLAEEHTLLVALVCRP